MRVAVEEAAADTAASAEGDTLVSAVVPILLEAVAATAEPDLVGLAAAMARSITHPECQRDATVAMHRESRLEGRFMVRARERKVERLPGNFLGRHAILAAITFRKINPGLALRVSPQSRRVIMLEEIGIHAGSTLSPV
jgi:hypothetical protein